MNREEKDKLKENYKRLKTVYNRLKLDITKVPSESRDSYEMRCEMSILGMQIREIRSQLLEDKFRKFYPTTILENFIFGDEEEIIKGGR